MRLSKRTACSIQGRWVITESPDQPSAIPLPITTTRADRGSFAKNLASFASDCPGCVRSSICQAGRCALSAAAGLCGCRIDWSART